jgi:hypothetical protein
MSNAGKKLNHFVMNFKNFEKARWRQVAGLNAIEIYMFYTWKNEMMKRQQKSQNHNFWISISNAALWEQGIEMHRQTKAGILRKLKKSGLIDVRRENGSAYQILKLK